jgi:hypothetical protein
LMSGNMKLEMMTNSMKTIIGMGMKWKSIEWDWGQEERMKNVKRHDRGQDVMWATQKYENC